MLKSSFSFIVLSAFVSLAGCAAQAEPEPTSTQNDEIIGALTSPIGLHDHHMIGTWEPIDREHFHGKTTAIQFADNAGKLSYSMSDTACAAHETCRGDGRWFVTQNPLVWFFAGTYVEFHATGAQENTSLFVSRGLDGVIRLVDVNSWDWKLGRYANTWEKNPTLTVNDLWK